jgi:hypothetical protein
MGLHGCLKKKQESYDLQTNSSLLQRRAHYVGVLISLWLFLFAAQPNEFFLDGLKKLEQRSHKCVELRGEYVE